jgi:hypothetical protein
MAMASLLYPDEEQAQIQAPQGGPLSLLQPPDDRPPALQPDPRADALGTVYQQVMDAMEAQRRISAARGLWDDNTGLPTKAGLLDAIGQAGTAVALGTGGAPERPGFTAYHGSPHQFDAFDLSKIGTGEGAQAYGHGMYLAENEGVARSYKMAGQPSYLNPTVAKIAQDAHGEAVQRGVDDPIAAARNSLWEQRQATTDPILKRQIDDAYNNIEQLTKPGGVGHMYEVKVAADPERFLHWDKPLSEQHQDVIKALNNTPYPPHDMRMTGKEYLTALETNREMASKQGDPAALASRALQEAGIPGIKYLDQGSRGAGAGSHNYVVFSPEIMNIIRRYGLAGLMGGAGAAALGGTQQESQ